MTWQLASPSVSQLRQSETGTQDGSQCLYNPVVTSGLLYFCLLELIQNVQPILKVRGLSKSMNIKRMGLVGGHLRGCLPQTYTEKYTNINLHESSLYGHNCVIVIEIRIQSISSTSKGPLIPATSYSPLPSQRWLTTILTSDTVYFYLFLNFTKMESYYMHSYPVSYNHYVCET